MLGDLAKLVSGFFGGDSVNSESTFDVIDKSEGFVGLLECDDIHETGWEGGITSDFAVDLDQIVISGLKHPQTNQHLSKIVYLSNPSMAIHSRLTSIMDQNRLKWPIISNG